MNKHIGKLQKSINSLNFEISEDYYIFKSFLTARVINWPGLNPQQNYCISNIIYCCSLDPSILRMKNDLNIQENTSTHSSSNLTISTFSIYGDLMRP